ncbi:MAG TPA: L,D-transpeptidase family protein [Bacteroidales bacterium]|nr:L,D-transpeptidase family protein [Bacteroidales bacterium]
MQKSRKRILLITVTVLFTFLTVFLLFYSVPPSPEKEIREARYSLAEARGKNAHYYAEHLYTEASAYLDSAMFSWEKENQRFIYKRNYNEVIRYAGLSVLRSHLASKVFENNISEPKVSYMQRVMVLRDIEKKIDLRFRNYPLKSDIRERIMQGKLLLKEGETAWKNYDYSVAEKKINEAEYYLASAYEYSQASLSNYFSLYPKWKTWVDSTLVISDSINDYSIIVDKFSRKLHVYYDGRKHSEYSAELGPNWVGDKKVLGDKATPEGMYMVSKKLRDDSTVFYKALLLNYPNDEDTADFQTALARGILPHSSRIGGMIEIHGHGGKGIDWTEGCVALTDKEMDELFDLVRIGTPVTIVGSMLELDSVIR